MVCWSCGARRSAGHTGFSRDAELELLYLAYFTQLGSRSCQGHFIRRYVDRVIARMLLEPGPEPS